MPVFTHAAAFRLKTDSDQSSPLDQATSVPPSVGAFTDETDEKIRSKRQCNKIKVQSGTTLKKCETHSASLHQSTSSKTKAAIKVTSRLKNEENRSLKEADESLENVVASRVPAPSSNEDRIVQ